MYAMTTDLEYVHGYGYDSDILVHNHTDTLIDLFLAPSATYLDLLRLQPYTTQPSSNRSSVQQ